MRLRTTVPCSRSRGANARSPASRRSLDVEKVGGGSMRARQGREREGWAVVGCCAILFLKCGPPSRAAQGAHKGGARRGARQLASSRICPPRGRRPSGLSCATVPGLRHHHWYRADGKSAPRRPSGLPGTRWRRDTSPGGNMSTRDAAACPDHDGPPREAFKPPARRCAVVL